jgi:hypothetical protein
MRIDYDRPVKGRLANGFYWMQAEFSALQPSNMAIVYREATQRYGVETMPGSQLRRVSEWRELGWQFYRVRPLSARLPHLARPKGGAK